MMILFTVLAAFAIGFFVERRATAILTYLASGSLLFTFQTLGVQMDWLAGSDQGFGSSPETFPLAYSFSQYLGYGVVNLVAVLVGIGLVVLGHRVAVRRAARRTTVAVG